MFGQWNKMHHKQSKHGDDTWNAFSTPSLQMPIIPWEPNMPTIRNDSSTVTSDVQAKSEWSYNLIGGGPVLRCHDRSWTTFDGVCGFYGTVLDSTHAYVKKFELKIERGKAYTHILFNLHSTDTWREQYSSFSKKCHFRFHLRSGTWWTFISHSNG